MFAAKEELPPRNLHVTGLHLTTIPLAVRADQ
jgi:hypothetical protein